MQKTIISTGDGSHTVAIPELNVTYHSRPGAVQESKHVFIEAGLRHWLRRKEKQNLSMPEVGFGTGLNACSLPLNWKRRRRVLSMWSWSRIR